MTFFEVFGSFFEKWPMTDLTNIIVSMCLVSYTFCMIPHVLTVTFGLNLSGAWGEAGGLAAVAQGPAAGAVGGATPPPPSQSQSLTMTS